jgi:exosortase
MLNWKELIGESAGQVDVKRNVLFLGLVAVAVVFGQIYALMSWAYKSEYFTHIVLIPFVSAYLLFVDRKKIFDGIGYAAAPGLAIIGAAAVFYIAARMFGVSLNKHDYLALLAFPAIVFVVGAFILVYGMKAFREAMFPLFFLVFMIPVPTALLDSLIRFLQVGSTEFTALLFSLSGAPILREGFVFHLPGVSIEVAPQCSGIRSSMALVITCVLAGHMFLKTTWKKVVLVLAAIPITMFKNGIRITSLSLIGSYIDRRVLDSSLHRDGGIVFFVLALLLMAPILFLLRRGEK